MASFKMKTKKAIALLLCLGMLGGMIPASAVSEGEEAESPAEVTVVEAVTTAEDPDVGVADGAIHDEWSQDPATVKGSGTVCQVENGKRHLKADKTNGNSDSNPDQYPAVFIDETMSTALKGVGADGTAFLEVTFEPTQAPGDSRFGIYLNYENPGKALFIGADSGGWFWQKYGAPGNPWYQGTRVAAPAAGTKATLCLEWTGSSLTKATVNGQNLFAEMPLDFSSVVVDEANVGRVGFKAAAYGGTATDYYVSNIHYLSLIHI